MRGDDTLLVLPGTAERGICKFCRLGILWVIVARTAGRKARSLPFSLDVTAVGPKTQPLEHGPIYEPWPASALHTKVCTCRPKSDPTPRRLRRSARDGQGRMW